MEHNPIAQTALYLTFWRSGGGAAGCVVYINTLHLANFRNYAQVDLTLGRGLNIFVGENAQGEEQPP